MQPARTDTTVSPIARFGARIKGFGPVLGLLALWRQLCERLDVPTLPWAWPLGLALAGFFAAGSLNLGIAEFFSSTAWIALIGTAYVALQHMDQHLRAWRQVQWSASRQRWLVVPWATRRTSTTR